MTSRTVPLTTAFPPVPRQALAPHIESVVPAADRAALVAGFTSVETTARPIPEVRPAVDLRAIGASGPVLLASPPGIGPKSAGTPDWREDEEDEDGEDVEVEHPRDGPQALEPSRIDRWLAGLLGRVQGDVGSVTAEYGVVALAAAAFGVALIGVLRGPEIAQLLGETIRRALTQG